MLTASGERLISSTWRWQCVADFHRAENAGPGWRQLDLARFCVQTLIVSFGAGSLRCGIVMDTGRLPPTPPACPTLEDWEESVANSPPRSGQCFYAEMYISAHSGNGELGLTSSIAVIGVTLRPVVATNWWWNTDLGEISNLTPKSSLNDGHNITQRLYLANDDEFFPPECAQLVLCHPKYGFEPVAEKRLREALTVRL